MFVVKMSSVIEIQAEFEEFRVEPDDYILKERESEWWAKKEHVIDSIPTQFMSNCPDLKILAKSLVERICNQRLLETDFEMLPDRNPDKYKNYRQELRDLKSTVDPTLDENGVLNKDSCSLPIKPL